MGQRSDQGVNTLLCENGSRGREATKEVRQKKEFQKELTAATSTQPCNANGPNSDNNYVVVPSELLSQNARVHLAAPLLLLKAVERGLIAATNHRGADISRTVLLRRYEDLSAAFDFGRVSGRASHRI